MCNAHKHFSNAFFNARVEYIDPGGLGIRGTQVKSFIQDIVDEVAPIKKAPLWG